MDKKEYILRCPACSGFKTVSKMNKQGTHKRTSVCRTCKGKGKVTYSKDFLMFKVMELNRKININWEAISHKRSIPKRFFVNVPFDCPECLGEQKVLGEKCNCCNGTGYKSGTTKQVFKTVHQAFLRLQFQRDNYNKMIADKVWLTPEASDLPRLKPEKHEVVCTRCTHFLNENNRDVCEECTNRTKTNNVYLFKPITSAAEKWYRKEGYKWNYRNRTHNKERIHD